MSFKFRCNYPDEKVFVESKSIHLKVKALRINSSSSEFCNVCTSKFELIPLD